MAYNIFVEGLLPDNKCFNFITTGSTLVQQLKEKIYFEKCILPHGYFITSNGIKLENHDEITFHPRNCFTVLKAHPLLLGGKGGFGTLIRAMGTQISKGSRKGACRDLSGRRMRDVEAEKKLAEWAAQEPERKKKSVEERKKRQRKEPKHQFNDSSYMDQIRSTEENINTALQQGFQAATTSATTGQKRRLPGPTERPTKKQKIWVGVEVDTGSDEHDYSSTEELGCVPLDGVSELSRSNKEVQQCEEVMDTQLKNEPCASCSDAQVECAVTSASLSEKDTIAKAHDTVVKVVSLEEFDTVEQLVSVGGDRLKHTLQSMGLKCGGTVAERAQRLLATKGKSKDELDPSLFAKNKRFKTKK